MAEQLVTKVVLSSKKEVLLRDVKIKHTELAAQAAAPRAQGDPNVLMILMQKELMKLLVCQVDGKPPTAGELEDMDEMFTLAEYAQLSSVVKKLTGGDDLGKLPTTEVVSFGSK